MKPVAPARRPVKVEDGVRVDRGMRPCAEGSRYWPGRRISRTSCRIKINSIKALLVRFLKFRME